MKLTYNDSTHSYWLGGRRVKSASKVAKIAADSFTIDQWNLRQIAIGMTLDPTLAERVAVDLDNREAIQEVCDDAKRAAKSGARASRGTQRHRVFELVLLGQEDQFITAQQHADAEVLNRTLDAYGLEPIEGYVEQFVAWPDHGVVGRFDAVLGYRGAPALFDLKSGVNAVKYPHSTVVQLALYLFAPHVSARIDRAGDKSTVTEWTTMPDGIDLEAAYIIHCDDDHDVGELWRCDLVHGRKGAEYALSIVDWRKQHDYGKALTSKIEPEASPSPSTATGPSSLPPAPAPEASPAPTETTPPVRTKDDVVARYTALSPTDQETFRTKRVELGIDNNDVNRLWQLLDDVDHWRFVEATPPAKPETAPPPNPPAPAPDEGGPIDDVDLGPLGDLYEAMDEKAGDWFADLLAQGRNGHTWEMRAGFNRTVRRYEIYRGLIRLTTWEGFDASTANETALEPLVWDTAGRDDAVLFANVAPGVALGTLNAEQAKAFSTLVDELLADRASIVVDDTGRWRLNAAA